MSRRPTGYTQSNLFFSQAVTVEKETPLDVDPGLLLVTDLNPIEEETYKSVKMMSFKARF